MQTASYEAPDGVIWDGVDGETYWSACAARDSWASRATRAERLLAAIVDGSNSQDLSDLDVAIDQAEEFLRTKMGKMQ